MAAGALTSRLIGREAELAALRAALDEAAAGRPSLAFVAGESGVGKTRLLSELAAVAREAGARVLSGECVDLGEDELPYAPLVGALRPLARAGDPAVTELPPAARQALATLLPDLGGDGAPMSAAEAADDRRDAQPRLFEALLSAFARAGEPAPVVLIVEDVHWADRSTRDFLTFLGRNLVDERLLVAVSYRPDELHRRHPLRPLLAVLERTPGARRIDLRGLGRDEIAALAREITGTEPSAELIDRVLRRSEGNALFAEELLAAGYGPLPPSLADALMIRIERLPAPAQEIARVLAVAQPADHALLEELAGLDAATLRQALRDAVAGHVVVVGRDDRYAMRHVLLREVLYDDLLPGERAALHLGVAQALERRRAEAGPDDWALAAAVAHHYNNAGDQPAALRSAITAAQAAGRVHAAGDASALLERALELWDRVPDAAQLVGFDHPELLRRAAHALKEAGEDARRLTLLNEAIKEVRAADADDRRVPHLLRERSMAEWALGRGEASRATLDLARRLLPDDASPQERTEFTVARLKLATLQFRIAETIELGDELLAGELTDRQRADVYNNAGPALIMAGERERGEQMVREAIALARAGDMEDLLEVSYTNLADALQLRGCIADAQAIVDEGLREVPEQSLGYTWLLAMDAELAIDRGDWSAARAALGRVGRASYGTRGNLDLRRAELALGVGDHETAARTLEEVDAMLVDSLEPQFVAVAGVLRAELERRVGDLHTARAAVEAAIERVEFCSDDSVRLGRLAESGVAVEADAAQRARDLGDAGEAAQAIARAELMLARARATAQDGWPLEEALRAGAEGHFLRATGQDASEAWDLAARRWEELGRPVRVAAARWRAAESCLEHGRREAAALALAQALALARDIGAGWLTAEMEGLATRARLTLDAAPEPAAPAGDGDPFGLTARERQVLALVARGATNREIGAELYMAEKTASVHVSRILAKLDVRSRTEAAAVAHRLGLVQQQV